MDPITELKSDLRALAARAPQHPGLRRDFLRYSIALDQFIGAAVEVAEQKLPAKSTDLDFFSVEEEPVSHKPKPEKVEKVMHEYKAGTLHSGSKTGPIVTDPKQAKAIAISEATKHPKKK